MSRRDQREAARDRVRATKPRPICPNCGQPGPHFAPPSMGEPGMWLCEAMNKQPPRGVTVGRAAHVHAFEGGSRAVCGQVFDADVGSWDRDYFTPRCAKCMRILNAR